MSSTTAKLVAVMIALTCTFLITWPIIKEGIRFYQAMQISEQLLKVIKERPEFRKR